MRRSVERIPRSGPRPAIRLRPAPAFEPPFDDEIEPHVWAMEHQLAFDWGTPPMSGTITGRRTGDGPATGSRGTAQAPAPDSHAPGSHAPGSHAPGSHAAGAHEPGAPEPVAAVAGASAEARVAVRRFVAMCVEVLNGYRPAAHLRSLSVPGNASGVVAQAMAATQRVAEMRRSSGRGARSASRHGRRPDPVVLHKWRLCEPRPGAVEAAVLLVTGERTWAVALRLERHQQSWSATTLRLI